MLYVLAGLMFHSAWSPYLFAATGSGWTDDKEKDPLSGSAGIQYRMKKDNEATYHRLFQTLDLWYLPFENDSGLVFSGEAYENPGKTDERSGSVWDTYGDAHGFVQEACFQWNGLVPGLDAIAGRQYIETEFPVHLDGLYTRYRFPGGKGYVYMLGGYTADPYAVMDWEDSRQAGAGVLYRIFNRTMARLEYLGTWEDYSEGVNETYNQGALVLQQYWDGLQWGMTVRSFDSEVESAKLYGSFLECMGDNSEIDVSYYRQFRDVEQMPSSQSPFLSLLGPIKPYHRISLYLSKQYAKTSYGLYGGLDLRLLDNQASESEYNHSYVHVFAACDKEDLFGTRFRLTVQANYWQNMDAEPDDKSVLTGGGELAYEFSDRTEWTAGSSYALFAYDYYSDLDEKTDVYTVYSTLSHPFGDAVRLKGEYELQIYDQEEHRFNLSMDIDF